MKDWPLKFIGKRSIWSHVLFWLSVYVIFTFVMSYYGDWREYSILNILNLTLFTVAYYLLRYWLIPKTFSRYKPWVFILGLFVCIVMCYTLYWELRLSVFEAWLPLFRSRPYQYLGEFLIKTIRFFSPALVLIVWEFQHDRRQGQIRIRELEKEKLTTELKFLKAQINPHFLFNTLNNLYSFVVTESPKASDMLDRMQGILEYVFDKSQRNFVPLSAEMRTVEDYLALEKIRYGDRLKVTYKAVGNMMLPISPLIILSVVENAFKHGASGDINEPKIVIEIHTKNTKIYCMVWNTKIGHNGEINDEYKSGIGLSNIKRQLSLIYPDRHRIKIDDIKDSFTLSLTINTVYEVN